MEDIGFMLDYKGDDGDLKETRIQFVSNNYSRFSLPLPYNYSSKKELEFSRDPMYNNSDRRDNKLIKYNRFYNDYKTKENYFYMKQYLERLSNIHDLDDITCLEEFKRRMKDDMQFFNMFRKMPINEVNFLGVDDAGTEQTGIDAGGVRPDFYTSLAKELSNTFYVQCF